LKVTYADESPIISQRDERAKVIRPPQNMGESIQIKIGDVDAAIKSNPAAVVVRPDVYEPVQDAQSDGDERDDRRVGRRRPPDGLGCEQYMMGTRGMLAAAFGLAAENVRALCPFVGGGFSEQGAQWPHTFLAAAAAKVVGRPVKLMLTRPQMFTSCGHRPLTEQAMTLGRRTERQAAGASARTSQQGSIANDFLEPCGLGTSRILYANGRRCTSRIA